MIDLGLALLQANAPDKNKGRPQGNLDALNNPKLLHAQRVLAERPNILQGELAREVCVDQEAIRQWVKSKWIKLAPVVSRNRRPYKKGPSASSIATTNTKLAIALEALTRDPTLGSQALAYKCGCSRDTVLRWARNKKIKLQPKKRISNTLYWLAPEGHKYWPYDPTMMKSKKK